MTGKIRPLALAAAVSAAVVLGSVSAQAATKIRLTLDWIPQSTHGLIFIAQYEGYYKAEGLEVKIDAGRGSADAVKKLVSGTHDIGLADINALIQYNAQNKGAEIKSVMMMYEQPPFSIFVLKKSGITHPKQLVGKTLGAPVFDASYKLFPAFAKAIGIDPNAVQKKNMDPRLREPMLIKGQVDAISGHVFSSMLNLKAAGIKEEDVTFFMYGDHGMESYANAVAVRPDFLAKNPDALRGFVRATIKATRDMVQKPQLALDSAKKFEPLLNEAVEADRLRLGIKCCVLTPNVQKNGYGGIDMARLQRSIDQAADAYGIANPPKAADMWLDGFLPPQSERFIHK
ncbi:MAG: ABC transporter substrate-binding protein [Defluviicoccus sp.]|nr:ABC transporter substrate-binding protein [Defluviicoccus sp.]